MTANKINNPIGLLYQIPASNKRANENYFINSSNSTSKLIKHQEESIMYCYVPNSVLSDDGTTSTDLHQLVNNLANIKVLNSNATITTVNSSNNFYAMVFSIIQQMIISQIETMSNIQLAELSSFLVQMNLIQDNNKDLLVLALDAKDKAVDAAKASITGAIISLVMGGVGMLISGAQFLHANNFFKQETNFYQLGQLHDNLKETLENPTIKLLTEKLDLDNLPANLDAELVSQQNNLKSNNNQIKQAFKLAEQEPVLDLKVLNKKVNENLKQLKDNNILNEDKKTGFKPVDLENNVNNIFNRVAKWDDNISFREIVYNEEGWGEKNIPTKNVSDYENIFIVTKETVNEHYEIKENEVVCSINDNQVLIDKADYAKLRELLTSPYYIYKHFDQIKALSGDELEAYGLKVNYTKVCKTIFTKQHLEDLAGDLSLVSSNPMNPSKLSQKLMRLNQNNQTLVQLLQVVSQALVQFIQPISMWTQVYPQTLQAIAQLLQSMFNIDNNAYNSIVQMYQENNSKYADCINKLMQTVIQLITDANMLNVKLTENPLRQ